MNSEVLPTFDAHDARIDAALSDNGREFCGREDQHPYELFLQLEGIEHKRTRVKRPQSNGIVEGRRTLFKTIEEMQVSLDEYLVAYNTRRPHQGRGMNGITPAKALIDGLPKETSAPTSKPNKAA